MEYTLDSDKFYMKETPIRHKGDHYASGKITINGELHRYSADALKLVTGQFNAGDVLCSYGQYELRGSEEAIKSAFRRKGRRGSDKIVRLHHTGSRVMEDVPETMDNLLQIGYFRSCIDNSSKTRFTSPVHVLSDGFFHLGYDIVIVPTKTGATAIVNPTCNYYKWLDVAIVGMYNKKSPLSIVLDSFLHDLIWKYGNNLTVRDHGHHDPGVLGVNDIHPISIRDLKSPIAAVASDVLDAVEKTPVIGDIYSMTDHMANSTIQFSNEEEYIANLDDQINDNMARSKKKGGRGYKDRPVVKHMMLKTANALGAKDSSIKDVEQA